MKNTAHPTNRIADLRKARKITQQQLADAVGAHWITISKLERGVMRLSDEWRAAIAKALKVDEWMLIPGAKPLPTVHVEGRIEEGGRIHPLEDDDLTESFRLSTDYFTHPAYRWFTVAGDALWPWYQDGDRLCLWHLSEDEIESVRGRICLAWWVTDGGEEDVTIGVLERGKNPGLYTINRMGSAPVRDIKPVSLAVIAMAVYYLGPDSFKEPFDTPIPF